MPKTQRLYALLLLFLSWGCSAGNMTSADPTERGLSYVAAAILTSALVRALFNK